MSYSDNVPWEWFAQWGPVAFVLGGLGSVSVVSISVLEILVYGQRFQVMPEWGIALIVVPSLLATFIGLFGFYPYVSDHSPRLALGGIGAATFGGGLFIVTIGVTVVLDLLGIAEFTGGEDIPALTIAFVLLLLALLASFLLYGVASTLTKRPSRAIGLLLLVPIVEPLFTILFDVLLSIEVPGGPLGTLAAQGIALIVAGYLLSSYTEPTGRAEPTM